MTVRARHVLGLGLGLVLAAELLLRIWPGFGDPPLARRDDEVEYVLEPDRRYIRFGNRVEINGFGLRAPDMAASPPEGETRVLVIGDSVIYGNHFLDQSETVAARMTARLAGEAALAGCRALAVPVAVSSWGPVNQAAYLDRHGTFGARAALIVVSGHDLYDTPSFSSNVVPYRLSPSPTALDDAVRAVLQRLDRSPGPEPALAPPERAAMSLAALGRMTDRLRAAGATPYLVYHPTLRERATGPLEAAGTFRDWAAGNGVAFVDLASALPDPGAYRDHIHPAAEGAARLADLFAGLVRDDLGPC